MLAWAAVFPLHTAAEAFSKSSNIRVALTMGSWLTEGRTRWSFSNQSALFGNPTSELDYKDVGTTVTELGGKVTFATRPFQYFARGQVGYGAVGGGRLVDDDYVSAAGAAAFGTSHSGAHRFSRTQSHLDGSHIWYVHADLGLQREVQNGRGLLGAFVGYQHREEHLNAVGVTQVECTALVPSPIQCSPAGIVTNVNRLALTNTAVWDSVRSGVEAAAQLGDRISLDGRAMFLLSRLNNKDIHHLRSDLKQDPSVIITGTGIGFTGEANASLVVSKQLSFDVGYRYWWQRVSDGDVVVRGTTGDSQPLPLTDFRSIRQGVTVGLRSTF